MSTTNTPSTNPSLRDSKQTFLNTNTRRLLISTVQLELIKNALEYALANGFQDIKDEYDTEIGQCLIDMIPETIDMEDTEMLHGFTL